MSILNLLFSIFGYSIWEEYSIIYLLLFFIKKYEIIKHDYFETGYNNIFLNNLLKVTLYSALPISIISDLLATLHINSNIITVFSFILLYISIFYLTNERIRFDFKIILCLIATIFISGVINLSMYGLCSYITNINLINIKNEIEIKILFGLLPRIIEFTLLGILIFKNNVSIQTNVIKTIFKNKKLLILTGSFLIINSLIPIFFCQNILLNNIFKNTNDLTKLFIVLGMLLYSISIIIMFYFITTFIQMNERKQYKYGN